MKLPNIKKYKSTKDYFEAIYELNKKEKKIFSYRYFAGQLDWPVSYLNDVVKGRKKTTLTRAIQFSQKFKLNTFQTEYLIFLSLAESEKGDISQFFIDKIEAKGLKKEKTSSVISMIETAYKNPLYNILYILIDWGQGKLPIDELASMQTAFPELHDKKLQKEAIAYLMNNKIIKKVSTNVYTINANTVFSLDDNSFLNQEDEKKAIAKNLIKNLENLIKLYQSYSGRALFFNSYINFPVERLPEVVERFHSLRDWMINLSQEEKSDNLLDHESFQVEMHLFPILSSKPTKNTQK